MPKSLRSQVENMRKMKLKKKYHLEDEVVLSSDSSHYESSSSEYEFMDDDVCSSDSAWSDSEMDRMGISRKKDQDSDGSDSESIPLAKLVDSASFQRKVQGTQSTVNSKPDNVSSSALVPFPSTSKEIRSTPTTCAASADSSETITLDTTSIGEPLPSTSQETTSSSNILVSGILIDAVETPSTSVDEETHTPAAMEIEQYHPMNNRVAPPDENEPSHVMPSKGRKRSAKRVRNEEEWKRNASKRLRACGEKYVSSRGKVMPKREMGPVCSEKCQWKCGETAADERKKLFDAYWAIGDTTGQRQFIVNNAQTNQTKRPIQQESSRRKVSYVYHLILSGEKRRVCKTFFLNTLGIKEDVVYGAFKKMTDCGVLERDGRGSHGKQRRIPDEDKEHVRRHIASFPTVPSHYCRKSTNKNYLGSELNMSKMYSLYAEKCKEDSREPVTRSMYCEIFHTSFSLAFHQPKKDQCDQCLAFDNSLNPSEEFRASHTKHLQRKDMARAFKAQAKAKSIEDPTVATGCFDLQQVLPCPRGEASSFYYKRKLSVYNLTVYDMTTQAARCYMWPEHVSARGSNQVATCVFGYIKDMASMGKKTVYLFSDNCPGQNRNKGMASMLIFAINTVEGLQKIEHGFLEKGHTQNENDSVHAVIANATKGNVIYTPEQWYMMVRTARKRKAPYKVKEMSSADFMDFKKLSKTIKNLEFADCGKKINWTQIRSINVQRSDPFALHIKYEHDGQEMRVDLNRRKRNSTGNTDCIPLNLVPVKENCGITEDKKNDLLSLCTANLIPAAYHEYFKCLPLKNSDQNETDEEM